MTTSLLVTGGCGFIGSNLVRHLLADGARELLGLGCGRLVNLDALTYAGNPANVEDVAADGRYRFVQGSVADGALLERLFGEERVGLVMHLAAESHVDRSIDGAEPFLLTNVLGTQRLLDAARRAWKSPPVREGGPRFLHVSTDEVFGALGPDDPPFHEGTPYAPNSPYSASKAASDFLVRAAHRTHGLPVVTSNCSNNYGPYQYPEKLIPLMILNAVEAKPLPVYGDGRQVRDWLYVEDHCRALVAVLKGGRVGETYCVGGGAERPNVEIVAEVCRLVGELAPARENEALRAAGRARYEELVTFVKDRPGHDRRYSVATGKIERELGWRPLETLATGLRRTVAWYLANRGWCGEAAARVRRGSG